MPRKSSAALSVVPIDAARVARLRPPTSLSKLERETFVELASNAPHLKPTDVPTLASYAQCVVLCRKLGRNPTRPTSGKRWCGRRWRWHVHCG